MTFNFPIATILNNIHVISKTRDNLHLFLNFNVLHTAFACFPTAIDGIMEVTNNIRFHIKFLMN